MKDNLKEDVSNLYDVIIVGGGPAGLSSAIYAARGKYKVLVVEKETIGGQITITSEIVNYPGIEMSSGKGLTEEMKKQAESFGAEFVMAEVMNMEIDKDIKVLHTTKGDYKALGIVLAVGASPRKLGFKGEKEYQGRGVAYCATCDGEFFSGKDVFVIGGGFAAVEEGIFLTKYAKNIIMIVREEDFTCARTIADKVKDYDNIKVHFETEIIEAGGDAGLKFAKFKNNRTNEEWVYNAPENDTFGIFVFAGYVPNTKWLNKEIEKNEQGYIITDMDKKTNIEGIYGAGDVCIKNLRQVVTAVSDGAAAATSLEKYVSGLHEKLGIPELTVKKESRKNNNINNSNSTINEDLTDNGFISGEIKAKLENIFALFKENILIRVWTDESPLSGEMIGFVREVDSLTDRIRWEEYKDMNDHTVVRPAIEICRENGEATGIYFHGVPGGHEFNSFIMALYNVAGPGGQIEKREMDKINSIDKNTNIKILVSLSCTMCPETVMSSQQIASRNKKVTAEMFDLSHFPNLKEKYNVMSVPCTIINDKKIIFGKKSVDEMLRHIE